MHVFIFWYVWVNDRPPIGKIAAQSAYGVFLGVRA